MSKLNSAKTAIIPKPFVDLPSQQLYIEANANDRHQFVRLYARYKGHEFEAQIVSGDIERAWKLMEAFIVKHSKT